MKALVLGTVGLQVNVPVDKFPIEYQSIRFMDDQMDLDLAGVAYSSLNILNKLGNKVSFITGLGNDFFGDYIKKEVKDKCKLYYEVKDKPSLISVILYDDKGTRTILREGRKDYTYVMNPVVYKKIRYNFDYSLVTLSNFTRHILPTLYKKEIPIATDMQTIDNLTNEYGKEFMQYSDIIFFSDDHYDGDIEDLVIGLHQKYNFDIIGVGLGKQGCLICYKGQVKRYDSIADEVVNTVGAGDTLFSTFVHYYYEDNDVDMATKKALINVAHKIKFKTASQGFLTHKEIEKEYKKKW